MAWSAFVRVRRWSPIWGAAAGALWVVGAPAIAAAQPASREPLRVKEVLPIVRVSPGVGIHFSQTDSGLTSFDLDITGGAGLNIWSSDFLNSDVAIEASYTFSSEPKIGGHFAGIGATPVVYLHEDVGLGWAPKFVIGSTWQGFAVGMRNMLVIPVFWGTFQFEAGHQWLRVAGQDQHEIRILAGVDVVRPLLILSAALRGRGA